MAFYDQQGNALVGYTQGLQPLVSLSAVSATGPGAALDSVTCRGNVIMIVNSSAGVTAGSVQMQGSLDNVSWVNIGTAVSTTTANTVFPPVVATSQFVRYVRANIATPITGGTISASVGRMADGQEKSWR
jgi:hypothetical protein